MTAPPAGALEACLALLEKATPGPWKVFETEIPHYGRSSPHVARNIYTEWKHPQLQSEYPIVCQATGIGATKEGPAVQFTNISSDNAAALVAAVNLLRTHGPALLAALRLREGCEAWMRRIEREADAHTYFAGNADLRMTAGDHAKRAVQLTTIRDDLARVLEEG